MPKEPLRTVGVKLDPALIKKIDQIAATYDVGRSYVVRQFIKMCIKEQKHKKLFN